MDIRIRRLLEAQILAVALGLVCMRLSHAAQAVTKPTDKVVGAITSADAGAKKLTVKEDKTNTEYTVSLADTKTFLKVGPDLNLKNATRLTPEQLSAGDRVVIRGRKPEGASNNIDAASVLLMTATDVAQKHESEAADWKERGVSGLIASIDPASYGLTMTVRSSEGPKPVSVDLKKVAEYTRYSPENPKNPIEAKLADMQAGDQIRVLGTRSEDGSAIAAEKVYSGSFRTVGGTVVSVSPDGNELTLTDLQTKQPVKVTVTQDSSVRKLPPMMANMLARRLNPNFKPAGAPDASGNGGAPSGGPPSASGGAPSGGPAPAGGQSGAGRWQGNANGGDRGANFQGGPGGPEGSDGPAGRPPGARNGDLSQMIERLPKITLAELKPGDAVVVSAGVASDKVHLIATNIIAGVEPLFQSAPPSAGRRSAVEGMWNMDLSVPGMQ